MDVLRPLRNAAGHCGAASPYLNGVRSDTAGMNSGRPSYSGIVVGALGHHCSRVQSALPGLVFSKLVKRENHPGGLLKIHLPWLLPILTE